jgi:hypothetical protein
MSTNEYSVFIEKFAESHYCRVFEKKYRGKQWAITLKAIKETLSRYDNMAPNHKTNYSKLDVICPCEDYMMIKLDFTVAGSNVSAKSSGNRVVAAVDSTKKIIKILLVYSKNEIGPPNETHKWMNMIAQYYDEFKKLK